jgi:hypothetical protein
MSRMGTINAACRLSNAWCSSLGKLGRDLSAETMDGGVTDTDAAALTLLYLPGLS